MVKPTDAVEAEQAGRPGRGLRQAAADATRAIDAQQPPQCVEDELPSAVERRRYRHGKGKKQVHGAQDRTRVIQVLSPKSEVGVERPRTSDFGLRTDPPMARPQQQAGEGGGGWRDG